MEYIVYADFNKEAICGKVNLPAFTVCQQDGAFICHMGRPLCVVTSENAHRYFVPNYDGKGILRGEYITAIKMELEKNPHNWQKVWADKKCGQYKRREHRDHWLWNHDFYMAPIEDLEYIYNVASQTGNGHKN